MSHIIRLRGSWESAASGEVTRHTRKFGRPLIIDAHEQVWLVCQHVPGPARLLLNDRQVGTLSENLSFSANITDLLLVRNTIAIEVASAQPLGEVSIEIRSEN